MVHGRQHPLELNAKLLDVTRNHGHAGGLHVRRNQEHGFRPLLNNDCGEARGKDIIRLEVAAHLYGVIGILFDVVNSFQEMRVEPVRLVHQCLRQRTRLVNEVLHDVGECNGGTVDPRIQHVQELAREGRELRLVGNVCVNEVRDKR